MVPATPGAGDMAATERFLNAPLTTLGDIGSCAMERAVPRFSSTGDQKIPIMPVGYNSSAWKHDKN
jgi:hypothetical protein